MDECMDVWMRCIDGWVYGWVGIWGGCKGYGIRMGTYM